MHSASVIKALTEWASQFTMHHSAERVIFGGFLKKLVHFALISVGKSRKGD